MNKVLPVSVTKRFTFEAAHKLVDYTGACERLHGHSYKMEVTVKGIPDQQGLVLDFKNLKKAVNSVIIDKVDHQELNNVMANEFSMKGNTTCENMIIAFWWALDHELSGSAEDGTYCRLESIKLWETEDSYATLNRSDVYEGEEIANA